MHNGKCRNVLDRSKYNGEYLYLWTGHMVSYDRFPPVVKYSTLPVVMKFLNMSNFTILEDPNKLYHNFTKSEQNDFRMNRSLAKNIISPLCIPTNKLHSSFVITLLSRVESIEANNTL